MTRFSPLAIFVLALSLAMQAGAVDTDDGKGGGGGGTGGGSGGGSGGGTSSGSGKSGSSFSSKGTSPAAMAQARAAVQEHRYEAALKRLLYIVEQDPGNADAWNLLGFTYRMLGKLDLSSQAYLRVLSINPDHTGALEYQGELFITQGNLKAARANLARLKQLCGTCEEAEDLEKALQGS